MIHETKTRAHGPVRKAVVFRAGSIGDALNAKYLLENVHAAYPEARCCLVVSNHAAILRDLFAAYPWIEVREVNRKDLWSVWKLIRDFRGSDLVVTAYTKKGGTFSLPSKVIGRLLAKRGGYIGFEDASGLSPYLYDRILSGEQTRAPRLHEQDALHAAGIRVTIEYEKLAYVTQSELLAGLGLTGEKYLVLHLFAGSENRGLSNEKRQSLIDALARELPDVSLLLTGLKAERTYIEKLRLSANARVVAGDLSVQELISLIKHSTCMVSVGTGPSHIASNLGRPVIVLVTCVGIPWVGKEQYGEHAAIRIFSDTAACAGKHDYSKPHPACMESIDMNEVARSAVPYFKTIRQNTSTPI
jgi:ADP-heptose:LPS heptosyltransferase